MKLWPVVTPLAAALLVLVAQHLAPDTARALCALGGLPAPRADVPAELAPSVSKW